MNQISERSLYILMHKHMLVFHYNTDILDTLESFTVVVRTSNYNDIPFIKDKVSKNNFLHCVVVDNFDLSISSIEYSDQWVGIPLVINVASLGDFKSFIKNLPIIKTLNARFFIPLSSSNIISNQILSSLNIDSGILFNREFDDWEKVIDLMTYAIYSKTKHASIEPFSFIASNYDPQLHLDFSSVYFDNPKRYLHIDNKFNVAINRNCLEQNIFLTNGVDNIDNIESNDNYIKEINLWQNHFLPPDECSSCPAFRICFGKFNYLIDKHSKCKKLFAELLDAADHFRSINESKTEKELCQL